MSIFEVEKTNLVFTPDYRELKVVFNGEDVEVFDLTESPALRLRVLNNDYILDRPDLGETPIAIVQKLNIKLKTQDHASIEGLVLTGVGVLDLRDTGRVNETRLFHLVSVPVLMFHNGSSQYPFSIQVPSQPGITYNSEAKIS